MSWHHDQKTDGLEAALGIMIDDKREYAFSENLWPISAGVRGNLASSKPSPPSRLSKILGLYPGLKIQTIKVNSTKEFTLKAQGVELDPRGQGLPLYPKFTWQVQNINAMHSNVPVLFAFRPVLRPSRSWNDFLARMSFAVG